MKINDTILLQKRILKMYMFKEKQAIKESGIRMFKYFHHQYDIVFPLSYVTSSDLLSRHVYIISLISSLNSGRDLEFLFSNATCNVDVLTP